MSAPVTQVMLPGQVAAPEGPVDMQTMYVMHHGFRRDLRRFAAAVAATPVAERATWALLLERWEVFAEVLHHHHSGEDAGIWPWLRERCGEDHLAVLDAMEAEHGEIDPLLEACATGFRRLAETADEDARAALAVRVVAARDSLGRHLAHEETEAIALIQALMTQQEWQELDERHFKDDTLTLGKVVRLVPWAAYDVPRDVLTRVLDEAGLPFRVVWLLTRRRFARREARAFAWA
ncbi:hemerythrin domain-containing protein [Nocardioides sp. W7]|uniref:hemerythrin domain-containing protein n=1 Tax=Nocardioides sp. W7 TaxID=2931390 RepID=UPI001FD62558|nr:hemerythrin domain-containing protein [Nocardioides sp. W7]